MPVIEANQLMGTRNMLVTLLFAALKASSVGADVVRPAYVYPKFQKTKLRPSIAAIAVLSLRPRDTISGSAIADAVATRELERPWR